MSIARPRMNDIKLARILTHRNQSELAQSAPVLFQHFEEGGGPVMCGGGHAATILLGASAARALRLKKLLIISEFHSAIYLWNAHCAMRMHMRSSEP